MAVSNNASLDAVGIPVFRRGEDVNSLLKGMAFYTKAVNVSVVSTGINRI